LLGGLVHQVLRQQLPHDPINHLQRNTVRSTVQLSSVQFKPALITSAYAYCVKSDDERFVCV
jgi:hypothetical protein